MAVDAMGGDNAPEVPVQGACLALTADPDIYLVLIGRGKILEKEAARNNFPEGRYEIVHASQVIGMDEPPVAALRRKKDSSIDVALTLHRMGKVQGVVSAGSTGAQVVASMTRLGRIEGVLRPVIGSMIPTEGRPVMLLDVGANTDCKGVHLFQFGVMGAIFQEMVSGIKNPRVGLLSIGSEQSKGNNASLFAYHLLSKSHLNFIGNIEGGDLLAGKADVAVCDGFTGNLLLKFAESFPKFLFNTAEAEGNATGILGLKTLFYRKLNPETQGGVPILGVNGISVVCHGSSTSKAMCAAVLKAAEMADKGMNLQIAQSLSELHRFYEVNKYYLNLGRRWKDKRERSGWDSGTIFPWRQVGEDIVSEE